MPEIERGLWLLTHRDLARVARIRAVMELLGARIPNVIARNTDASASAPLSAKQ